MERFTVCKSGDVRSLNVNLRDISKVKSDLFSQTDSNDR